MQDARMWRVMCNACKGRGHFGRNCPFKDNDNKEPVSLEAASSEARAEAAAERERGDVRWVIFHDDEEPTRRRQSGHRGTSTKGEISPRVLNRRRINPDMGRFTAAAVQLAKAARDDKQLRAEKARYLQSAQRRTSTTKDAEQSDRLSHPSSTAWARASDMEGQSQEPLRARARARARSRRKMGIERTTAIRNHA